LVLVRVSPATGGPYLCPRPAGLAPEGRRSAGEPAKTAGAAARFRAAFNGKAAAPTTVRRRRAVFNNALQYAVELEELAANNLSRVGWRAPKVSEVVDRRVVINPDQARELLTAVTYVGRLDRGRDVRGFFACLYFAGLRPAEALGLREQDCRLPRTGWAS
jgi:integrase